MVGYPTSNTSGVASLASEYLGESEVGDVWELYELLTQGRPAWMKDDACKEASPGLNTSSRSGAMMSDW